MFFYLQMWKTWRQSSLSFLCGHKNHFSYVFNSLPARTHEGTSGFNTLSPCCSRWRLAVRNKLLRLRFESWNIFFQSHFCFFSFLWKRPGQIRNLSSASLSVSHQRQLCHKKQHRDSFVCSSVFVRYCSLKCWFHGRKDALKCTCTHWGIFNAIKCKTIII